MKIKFLAAAVLLSGNVFAQTLKDAQRLTDNEQYDLADAAYRTLIQKEPANGTNWFYLGENYWKSENADSAKLMYEKGKQVDPTNPINLVGIGKYLLETGNTPDARASFDKALTMSGAKTTLVQSEVAEAFIHTKNKDLGYATKLLNNAIAVDAKNPELFILLGDVYSEQNNGTVAAENYNKALDLDKNSVKAIVRKGQLYKRSTNHEGAAGEFQTAVKIDPSFAPAHRELAEAYLKLRKLEDAKQEYRTYLELSKNNDKARLRFASALFTSGEYAAALSELNQLSKVDSGSAPMMRLFAYTTYETNDYTKALPCIIKVFEIVPENKRTVLDYEYYGKILSKSGQDSLAVIYFEKGYLLDTTQYEVLPELGTMYMKMKRYAEAQNAFERRLNGRGLKSADFLNTGRAAYFNKNFMMADSMFSKVNEVSPTWPPGFLWRAQSNVQMDLDSKLGLAKPHYEKYIEVANADTANITKYKNGLIEANKYLGGYYYLINKQTDTSKSYWKKVLELDPEDKQAKQVIEGMNQKK